ncbi:hypothetical protein [Deinococcus enclensis]|uniref:Uncharacterized protein n=1 Tax=Deinococcus enclensis TaxID=1049582 RepID=A0ABT9M9L9_9DEIO|nr:hypothetical protein [Deinococcus enclensis]MDP9763211.1 hypothetical protein [Deinococcus enclensis]
MTRLLPSTALLTALALTVPAALPGAGAAPAASAAADLMTRARLAQATYVIQAPEIRGNPNLLNGEQRETILRAMKTDSGAAIKRRYPQATITTDGATPNAIRVTPILITPGALLPWLSMGAQLQLDFPEGRRVILSESHSVLTVYQHQADAANFVFDSLSQKLP